MIQKVIYPGSFDPITNGHLDLIKRASRLFPKVIVGVAKDTTGRRAFFSFEERYQVVKEALKPYKDVIVKPFEGLLVEFYRQEKADALIRGLRNGADFEYEMQLAQVNNQLLKEMETIFLAASLQHLFVSASLVREVAALGGEFSAWVPEEVVNLYRVRRSQNI